MGTRGLACAAACAAMVLGGPVTGAAAQTTERVSVTSAGLQASGFSMNPSISGDGRFVAFQSTAADLVAGDTNELADVFVHDRLTGTTERVSVNSLQEQAVQTSGFLNGSGSPAISADGRYVAFASMAENLVPGDVNQATDVFVRDRLAGTTERVNVDSAELPSAGAAGRPTISGDGRHVAFVSSAADLVAGDLNAVEDVYLRDRTAGTTQRISVSATGGDATGGSSNPAISADGRFVAFESDARNLVPGDQSLSSQIYVRDRATATTEIASVNAAGVPGNGSQLTPAISGDGRVVAFGTSSTNLAPGDPGSTEDIYVRDRVSGTTERVSVDSQGQTTGGGYSYNASLDATGRLVAFTSAEPTLVPGDTNSRLDVFVHDRATGTTERVSVSSAGVQGVGHSVDGVISADGSAVAFEPDSNTDNLVPGDTNQARDILVRVPAASPVPGCELAVTRTFTEGRDVVENDLIHRDRWVLLGGDDDANSGHGADCLEGGRGNDVLVAEDGADTVLGQEGDDELSGGDGPDRLFGGQGADVLLPSDGLDPVIDGGAGNDRIFSRDGRVETVRCGPGFDRVYADPRDLLVDCEARIGSNDG